MSNNIETIEHFSRKDIIITFFGALLVATGFLFKGRVLEISMNLGPYRVIGVVFATLAILAAEIYLLGYSRVRNKRKRTFGEFMIKRITTVYLISLFVCAVLIMLYNICGTTGSNICATSKIIIAVSFPTSIGAAMTDLFKKF